MNHKKVYAAPKLVTYGSIEQITLGPGGGWMDAIFGIGDGNGGLQSCRKNPNLPGCGS